jgi:hypothetical protein
MAHLSDGTLRRMLDDPDAITAPDREHYAGCADCRARHDAMADDARGAANLLAVPAANFDASAAYQRVQAQDKVVRPRFGIRLPVLRPSSQRLVFVLAAVLVLGTVITASVNVSQIFAPKTVKPVPVTLAELQSLPDLSAYGTVTWSVAPQPSLVPDAATAAQIAGFTPPKVTNLPAGISSTVTYGAMPQAVGVFKFDAAKAAAAAQAQGKTLPAMPAGMDGSTLTLTMGPAIVEIFGELNIPDSSSSKQPSQLHLPQLVVAESKAPSVTSTGVSVKELEDYLLAQPGISPQLAADIRAIGDPTTTLPIPVPVQYATSSKVQVQGVDGVALGDNTGVGAAVVWIKSDVFFVGGSLKQSDVLSIANGLS